MEQQTINEIVEAIRTMRSMLADLARDDDARRRAQTGLMRACFGAQQYADAVQYAQAVGGREARFIQAKSYRTMGQRDHATAAFEELAANTSDAYGAESAYILILDAYDRGNFSQVEQRVYAFSESGSGQLYWLAKSFIILGDSFADRGDLEQAEATFTSILDGYEPTREDDDVPEQVRSRLQLLKTKSK